MTFKLVRNLILAAAASVALGSSAIAALLTGTVNKNLSGVQNISAAGQLDWAIWNNTSNTAAASFAPTNEKFGSPGLISDITHAIANQNLRGVGSLTQTFSYNDGISPSAQNNITLGGIISQTLAVGGNGPQFTVQGNPNVEYVVSIWGSGGNGDAVGVFTASLNGAPDVVLNSQVYSSRSGTLFTINFKPDLLTDLLTIKYVVSDSTTGNNQFTAIQAVAVSAIPEPSMLAAAAVGLALTAVILRRRASHSSQHASTTLSN